MAVFSYGDAQVVIAPSDEVRVISYTMGRECVCRLKRPVLVAFGPSLWSVHDCEDHYVMVIWPVNPAVYTEVCQCWPSRQAHALEGNCLPGRVIR